MTLRAKLVFAWYDFWIGAYYDRKKRRLYFFPIPMVGLFIERPRLEISRPTIRRTLDAMYEAGAEVWDDVDDGGTTESFHEERGDVD